MKLIAARTAAALLMSLALSVSVAQVRIPDGVEHITSVEGITEYLLGNGLRVLLFPDPSKATITVNVTYLVGSVHESAGEAGMAHLLEHMLFKGSRNHPDILKEMQDRGAQMNGTTAWERTNYFETFDASDANLAWAIELEADRMVNSFVSQADLDSEMTVVRNEFEASENNPLGVLLYRVLSTAYLWHGYGNAPIGTRSDIENVSIERLQAFYRKHYQPDNAVLVVAGRIDEARTLELIAEHFGAIPRPDRTREAYYTREPTQDGEREVVVRRVGDIRAIMAGYHTPPGTHEDFVPLQIAARVLTDEPSGRLYAALVEAGLAAQVGAQTMQLKDPGMIILLAIVRAEGSLEATREALLATVDGLRDTPITAEEVERAKNRILAAHELQMNNSQAVALALSNWAAIGDWRILFLDRDRVRAATVEHVRSAALAYLKPTNRTVGLFIPEPAPDRAVIPEPPNLVTLLEGYTGDEQRSAGEVFDATPANIEERVIRAELPGGVKLVMLPKETRGDAVQAIIRLNIGDEQSLMGTGRLGNLTSQMLMRGTASKSRQQIQDELSRRQSQLGVGGGPSAVLATMQTKREHLGDILELAIEVLREPSFPENELTTLRDLALAGLEFQRSEPQAVVTRAFTRHWTQRYEPGHIFYQPTFDEELEMIRAVTADGMREFHAKFFGATAAEVVVVGDFDPQAVERLIAAELDGWRSAQPYTEVTAPYPDPRIAPITEVLETPDKENAFFMAGMPVRMSDQHPDYPALMLGNYILGQGPASRLFSRVRGREGLSYGISSAFQVQVKSDGARFLVNAIAAPQNAARVEESFRDELASILRDGYTDDEIEAAKHSWAQSRQVARSQDQQLAGTLLALTHNDRTMAWEAELEARVRALTAPQVRDAMSRHLDLAAMAFMRGGDFSRAVQ
jgi:zinc protease